MNNLNMNIRTAVLLLSLLLPLCRYARGGTVETSSALPPDTLYRDSLYRRLIKAGSARLDCYFSYPPGGWQIRKDYGNNTLELGRLADFLRSSLSDTLVYVRRIVLTGYCSVEGSYIRNEELAKERVMGFRNYLDYTYSLSRRYPVETHHIGEDWEKLRELVAASALDEREEILAIIDCIDIFKGREKRLMDLNAGIPYRKMEKELFPLLRRVEIAVEYDLHRIVEEHYRRKLTGAEYQELLSRDRGAQPKSAKQETGFIPGTATSSPVTNISNTTVYNTQPSDKVAQAPEVPAERDAGFHPYLALKTNFIPWAGVTPELERGAFMPNVSLEAFFARRWSVNAAALYSNWDYDNHTRHWALTGYSLEPRFWFSGNGKYLYAYTGIYGQAGDFDIRSTDAARKRSNTANCTGLYFEGGISAGCYLPFGPRWGIELGIRAGYRNAEVHAYDIAPPYYLRNHDFWDEHFGITALNLSIGYRFGKGD